MPCFTTRSYLWELAILQIVFSVYMVQIYQIHMSWFLGVMTKRKWRYVFLKSIESFSFVIIICTTLSWLKIVAILLLNNYMYHIFLIGHPVHLFQTWLGELGVHKHQNGVLIWYMCQLFIIAVLQDWLVVGEKKAFFSFKLSPSLTRDKYFSYKHFMFKIWFTVNKWYLTFKAWQQIKALTSIHSPYCLILN